MAVVIDNKINVTALASSALGGKILHRNQWLAPEISLEEGIELANEHLKNKYIIRKNQIYYNLRLVLNDDQYGSQKVECDKILDWQDGFEKITSEGTKLEF